jgi:hypothetical protein
MDAPARSTKELKMKARMYRMIPVLALIAVVVEGLGAGVKWS